MFSYQLPLESSPTRVINVASGFQSASDWVSTPDADFDHKKRDKLFKDDVLFDSKRLLYVALTRAEHKVVLYWSAVGQGGESANTNTALAEFLASHLAGKKSDVSQGNEEPESPKLTIPVDQEPLTALMDSSATSSNGTISASHLPVKPDAPLTWSPTIEMADAQTSTAQYSRAEPLSTFGYSRWSYSQLSRLLSDEQDDQVTADVRGSTDESNSTTEKPTATKEIAITKEEAISSMPLYAIGGSNIFGNAVHEIIDSIDPASQDLHVNLKLEVERHFKHSHDEKKRQLIIDGILKSFHAPLGEPFAGNTLTTLGAAHRLSELEFNFHLPQNSIGAFSPNKIGELMLEHGQLNGLLFDYAQEIASSNYSSVIAGFMNGSIDAVFRVNAGSNPLYIVSDYKTDRLYNSEKSGANPLVAYHPENLVTHMIDSGYILQAMVYSVALHRYLQWRQPGYDPDIHLGGTAYLFLRGMTGFNTDEATPRPLGVFHWKPTTALVLALDALFAGRNN
jgi:exodeoxyribonuclease V beta subunit